MKPCGHCPYREDGEVFTEVYVDHIRPRGKDRSQYRRLGTVELAKAPYGESQTYHAGVVSEALQTWRGRWTRGQHRLDDAAPVECPGQLGCVVLHPSYGIEPDALADERRRRWLEHRAEPEQSDPGSIPAPHLLRVSRRTPCGARSPPAAPFYSHWASPGARGRMYDLGARVRNRSSTEASPSTPMEIGDLGQGGD